MQLKVVLYKPYDGREDEDNEVFSVATFQDAEKIGLRAGRALRDFIRNVPMRPGVHRESVRVECTWEEAAVVERAATTREDRKPRRKRLRSKT